MSRRHNGEGSIYPVKGGYRGYVWCTNPAGGRYRKYVKGKTYEDTQAAWLKLRDTASRGTCRVRCAEPGEIPSLLAGRGRPAQPRAQDIREIRTLLPAAHHSSPRNQTSR